jgi:folate-dependent phosphoribosylglycinamide formyltransferase PurN
VIKNQEKYSGVTVHLVNEAYDEGRILNQVKVEVKSDDTAEKLAARVLVQEHKIYINTLKMIIEDKIVLQLME